MSVTDDIDNTHEQLTAPSTLKDFILAMYISNPNLTLKKIAEATGASYGYVRNVISRFKRPPKRKHPEIDPIWRLPHEIEEKGYSLSHDQALKAIKRWVELKFAGRLNARINCSSQLKLQKTVLHRFSSVDLILYVDLLWAIKPLIAIQLTYNTGSQVKKLRNKIFADIVKALPSKAPVIIVFINKKLPKSYCFWARYLSTELNRVILISELIKYPETILFALHSLLETPLAHITRRVLYGSEREKATE